jgi:pimeloyl-ACP methyl ester carboxylesterase
VRVSWQKFASTEVQVFELEKPFQKVILFCSGLPGMGATVFEQRHAGALCDSGYGLLVIKHKGAKLTGAFAPAFVNNASRLFEGRAKQETHLGGGAATIDEWLDEPIHVLDVIADKFEEIHMIGNSFGAISALYALTRENTKLSSIKTVLLMAGAQGTWVDGNPLSIARIWNASYLELPHITQKVDILDPNGACKRLRDVYLELPYKVKALPEHMKLIYLVVEKDEILRLSDTQSFQNAIGGRGEIVLETQSHAWPEAGLIAHDMPNYKTEDLIQLIQK